jgi:hypothetical protein
MHESNRGVEPGYNSESRLIKPQVDFWNRASSCAARRRIPHSTSDEIGCCDRQADFLGFDSSLSLHDLVQSPESSLSHPEQYTERTPTLSNVNEVP